MADGLLVIWWSLVLVYTGTGGPTFYCGVWSMLRKAYGLIRNIKVLSHSAVISKVQSCSAVIAHELGGHHYYTGDPSFKEFGTECCPGQSWHPETEIYPSR